ncbi:hypothetical protein GF357_05050 [Candidatus Dojkabacteria bacterium]|nr:hypothetical protein [Candidatus Dojkabacteria bacterium]
MKNRNKWLFAGQILLLFVFFGFAILYPWTTVTSIVVVFAILTLIQGMFALIDGLIGLGIYPGALWTLIYGLVSVILGFMVMLNPDTSIVSLMYIFGAWILVSGILQVIEGIFVRKTYKGETALIINGLLSVLLSLVIFIFPSSTAIGFMWFAAIYLVLWIVFAIVQQERIHITTSDKE